MGSNVVHEVIYQSNRIAPFCLPRRNHESVFVQLDTMVGRMAVNNEVLLMLVDAGYNNLFLSNYLYGKLNSMPNVVVSVLDMKLYHVLVRLRIHNVDFKRTEHSRCFLGPLLFL